MCSPIVWTKLRGGIWNGARHGRVVATVVREPNGRYVGRVTDSSIKAAGHEAVDVREMINEALNACN